MTGACGSCVCSSAVRSGDDGRLVLATSVDHTATALRSLGPRRGSPLTVLAPGLLELRGSGLLDFAAAARGQLSSVEADEVRCAVVPAGTGSTALLARALTAPTLSAAGARVEHADLLPLFDDEAGSFRSEYQPIVDLASGRTVAHEALLRATAADGTAVLPEALFAAAEQSGWTHVLDRQHVSSHDGLTGLANRETMLARLDDEVARAAASGRSVAVLFLDLDGFKAVNDVHGHLTGDRVLVQVAERLRAGLRSGDLLARQGGDEFVAVLGDLDPLDAHRVAARAAQDLLATLARPVPVPGGLVQLSCSIGVSRLPADGVSAEALLARADAAMYRSKALRGASA